MTGLLAYCARGYHHLCGGNRCTCHCHYHDDTEAQP